MTYPTIEEVKRVAKKCGAISLHPHHLNLMMSAEQLHAFFLRGIEMGRKMQRETDHVTYLKILKIALHDMEAIRNNTGE